MSEAEMQVSLENREGLVYNFGVSVSKKDMLKQVQKRLQEIQRTTKLAGFRPGKVPMTVIRRRYYNEVQQNALQQLMGTTINTLLSNKKIRPASDPYDINIDENQEDKLCFEFHIEVRPEIDLSWLTDIELTRLQATISDSDIDTGVESLRQRCRSLNIVERPAAEGDVVEIDYVATVEGKPVSLVVGEEKWFRTVLIGKNEFPELEEKLKNCTAGQDYELDVTLPESAIWKNLLGKELHFSVQIIAVKEAVLPPLDEDLFRYYGMPAGATMKEFRQLVHDHLQKEASYGQWQLIQSRLHAALLQHCDFELPQRMCQQEIMNQAMLARQNNAAEGKEELKEKETDHSQINSDSEKNKKKQAEEAVSLRLIYDQIRQNENIVAEPERVRKLIYQAAQQYQNPDAIINKVFQDASALQHFERQALADQVTEWLLEQVKINESSLPLEEFRQVLDKENRHMTTQSSSNTHATTQ